MDEDAWRARLINAAKDLMARRLLKAALVLQGEAKKDYSTSNPKPHKNPAPKGQFPRGRTWNLRDSIAIWPDNLGVISNAQKIRVGYLPGAFYGAVLAAKGWKGIKDTYVRVYAVIRGIIQGQ